MKEEIEKHIKAVLTECSINNLYMSEASINNKHDLPEKSEELPNGALEFYGEKDSSPDYLMKIL